MNITKATLNFYRIEIKRLKKLIKGVEEEFNKSDNKNFQDFLFRAEVTPHLKEIKKLLRHYEETFKFINHYNKGDN